MPIFNVQSELVKQCVANGGYDYYIHVTTFANRTDYRENGYAEIPTNVDDQGVFHLTLYLYRADDIPDFPYETPVIHTIQLGQIPIDPNTGQINIKVYEIEESGITTKVGDSIISSADADEDIRPIKELAR